MAPVEAQEEVLAVRLTPTQTRRPVALPELNNAVVALRVPLAVALGQEPRAQAVILALPAGPVNPVLGPRAARAHRALAGPAPERGLTLAHPAPRVARAEPLAVLPAAAALQVSAAPARTPEPAGLAQLVREQPLAVELQVERLLREPPAEPAAAPPVLVQPLERAVPNKAALAIPSWCAHNRSVEPPGNERAGPFTIRSALCSGPPRPGSQTDNDA